MKSSKDAMRISPLQKMNRIRRYNFSKGLSWYEFCVCCGSITPYCVDTPVRQRKYYIEGCGQLCGYCYFDIYSRRKGCFDNCRQTNGIFVENDLEN